ncbi:RHS repeat domain-containing protein [Stenotrophomonas rhizophila]|uniref:RHS repeat domain-containing protein n=1 Tax=Stenotrophomonas rhizophila TaxID=216778 RepID=UPI003394DFEF
MKGLCMKTTGKVAMRRAAVFCFALASFAASSQEVVRYVHTDALGSPVAESDEAGTIISRFAYEPYGGSIGQGPEDSPGYTGHVSDASTGLTYMQQRYYDPEVGSFLSVDPVTAASNPVELFSRYRYANSNPYAYTDPDGRRACGQSTTCSLLQGQAGSVIMSGSGSAEGRTEDQAAKLAGKAAAEATSRTAGLRRKEYKSAGAAARAWFDAVMPVGIKFGSEIGVRIFQGMGQGAVLGNSVSDGMKNSITRMTLNSSVSGLGEKFAPIGYAHTHPSTDFFSGADIQMAQSMYSEVNSGRSIPLDFEAFVGLTNGKMYGWSYLQNGGKTDANVKYSTP